MKNLKLDKASIVTIDSKLILENNELTSVDRDYTINRKFDLPKGDNKVFV